MHRHRNWVKCPKILFLTLISVTTFINCHSKSPQSAPNAVFPEITEYTCGSNSISWNGRQFQLGTVIGMGVEGQVFELTENRATVHNLVLKIIPNKDSSIAHVKALEEIELATNFPGIYVPTIYSNLAMIKVSDEKSLFGAFLIKNRVNGPTLHSLVKYLERNPTQVVMVYESFLDFKLDLKIAMLREAQSSNYLWDFHANNIMFDFRSQKWTIIDANITNGFENLRAMLRESHALEMDKKHPIHSLFQFVNSTPAAQIDQNHLINKIIDFYLAPYEQDLSKMARRYYEN